MKKLFIHLFIFFISATIAVEAQRRVSPVEKTTNKVLTSTENKAKEKELKKLGFVIMGDSIVPDSSAMKNDSIKIRKMKYPLLTSVIIGANLWDPIMRLCGQTHGGMDFSAELSLWNRINPIIELGAGMASSTPEDMNFTYKGKTSLYAKIGANYNFTYNKTPDYMAMGGFRLGYSSFGYDINNVTVTSGYWNETATFDILNQKSHALWGELIFALRVKLFKAISAGWAFKYHFIFNYKQNENSDPWYIPGYGARTSSISGAFSIFYTLPLSKDKWPKDETDAYTGKPLPAATQKTTGVRHNMPRPAAVNDSIPVR